MLSCDTCPYPQRCAARESCISGKVRPEGPTLPSPTPMQVLTTAGVVMTQPVKKAAAKVKAAKKKDA